MKVRGRGEFAQHCQRTLVDRRLSESAAIGMGARERKKQIARLDAARIVVETQNWSIPQILRRLGCERHSREDLAHGHGFRISVQTVLALVRRSEEGRRLAESGSA